MKKGMKIRTINWHTNFEKVPGSYYDYVCSISSFDEETHLKISVELTGDGWREVTTRNNALSLFEKNKYLIRLHKIWTD